MVVVTLVVILSACYCGFAFGRADACCRPLSSARACFWAHFVLDAFSTAFFLSCSSHRSPFVMLSLCFWCFFRLPLCTSLWAVSPFTVHTRLFASSSEAPAAVWMLLFDRARGNTLKDFNSGAPAMFACEVLLSRTGLFLPRAAARFMRPQPEEVRWLTP